MADFFTVSGDPVTNAAGESAAIRAEFASIATGFTKVAPYTGNASKIIAINSAGTAQEAITTTGSGSGVRATSPTLVTPLLGTPTSGVLTNCTGYPASGLAGLGTGVATFLATPSSANLAAAITDETGSGALVFATTPNLVAPVLGVATATSINKVAITAPASSATLTIADGKTLTASNTLTFAGTDGSTLNVGTGGTLGTAALKNTGNAAASNVPLNSDIQGQTLTAYTTGGTATAFTLTPTPAITANTAGIEFDVTFNAAAGATPTLAVSGLTALNLKYRDSTGAKQAVTSTQVPNGWRSKVVCDGTDWVVREIPATSSAGLGVQMMHVREEQASGTQGGTSVATAWTIRTLNTVVANTITGASLASNQITLPAGTYRVQGRSVHHTDGTGSRMRNRLRNVTDAVTVGLSANTYWLSHTNTPLFICRFTIAAAKTFELQYWSQVGVATYGLGLETSTGEVEVFGEVFITKE